MNDENIAFPNIEAAKSISDLEDSLGVRRDFLMSLLIEDDWSLVVKLHALIESALSHLIVECSGLLSCSEIFSHLPLSDTQIGKTVFAKALGLLHPHAYDFIRRLSELRNALVHDVKNVDFDIQRYISSQPKDRKNNYVKALFFGHHSYLEPLSENPNQEEVLKKSPRAMLWMNGTLLMWIIAEQSRFSRERRDIDQARLSAFEDLLAGVAKDFSKETTA